MTNHVGKAFFIVIFAVLACLWWLSYRHAEDTLTATTEIRAGCGNTGTYEINGVKKIIPYLPCGKSK
jgi:hypothetical protein